MPTICERWVVKPRRSRKPSSPVVGDHVDGQADEQRRRQVEQLVEDRVHGRPPDAASVGIAVPPQSAQRAGPGRWRERGSRASSWEGCRLPIGVAASLVVQQRGSRSPFRALAVAGSRASHPSGRGRHRCRLQGVRHPGHDPRPARRRPRPPDRRGVRPLRPVAALSARSGAGRAGHARERGRAGRGVLRRRHQPGSRRHDPRPGVHRPPVLRVRKPRRARAPCSRPATTRPSTTASR